MTLDVSPGQAETLRDSSCEQPHGGDVFSNMSTISLWEQMDPSRCHGFVILVARILDYFGFADAGLVFNLFMVIFRAFGCNLEGIICQPAIWAQGELSVTRKALVLRVASGELAKHRPILDFGGPIGIFCVRRCIFIHRHDMMIHDICISNIIFSVCYEKYRMLMVCFFGWCFFGCFCVLYIYILYIFKSWIVRVDFEMTWLPDIPWHPDRRQCLRHRWITSSACGFG